MNCRFWPEISFCLDEIEKQKNLINKTSINLETLTSVREQINHLVEQLKISFEQELDTHFSSLLLFAIVAYIDEDVQRHILETGQGNWAPLQKDYYGAYNAGELFYETVDKILDDPKIPSIVLEVYYFVLKKGFQGKYRDSKTHIQKYLDILKDAIPVTTPKTINNSGKGDANQKKKIKKWHYYVGAGAATVCLFITLYVTTNMS